MSQSLSLEDPVETLSYNSRPFVLGSLIRFRLLLLRIFPMRSLVLFLLGSIIRSPLRRTSRNLALLVVALQHSCSIPRSFPRLAYSPVTP